MSAESGTPGSLQKWLTTALSYVVPVFAIGIPVLYVLGRVYKEAYWAKLQIPYSLLDYPVEGYLYSGFVAITNGLFRLVNWLPLGPLGAWLLTTLGLALILALVVSLRRWLGTGLTRFVHSMEKKLRSWKANEDKWHVQIGRPLLIIGQWINGAFLTFLLAILLLAVFVAAANSAGQYAAEQTVKYVRQSSSITVGNARAIAHLRGEPSTQSGILLECSSAWCVISRRGEFVAVRAEDVLLVDHCPATQILPNGAVVCDADSYLRP
ncbi:hypothetical protein [Pseudoxanthomonas sacheonensis]|uniref:hypothetical protein n=1 Tax=Pseudoxanthomonas sacheonensis TaxID=443615 RepID=UPI0013CF9204|nr:hypothetical protein [Pseudoxanthomonas sacheonensis]KAF1708653.1 hypothetical protein CSC73_08135 [Pseudoxanthomonas sacheonensis]